MVPLRLREAPPSSPCQSEEWSHPILRMPCAGNDAPNGKQEMGKRCMNNPNVTHPSHYNSGKIEVIEGIEAWGFGPGFSRGNAIKYIARAGKKDPAKEIEDLEKARWYVDREIERLKALKDGRDPVRPNDMNPRKQVLDFDFVKHIRRQRSFSERTFGSGVRTKAIIAHIQKELKEIEETPHRLEEWVDVMLLAFDGAWRAGYTPEGIAWMIHEKQTKNEARKWPDWRTAPPDQPIEHVREKHHWTDLHTKDGM